MPIFEIEHEGELYEVDAPDEDSAVRAFAPQESPEPAAPLTPVKSKYADSSLGEDVSKAIGGAGSAIWGVAKGLGSTVADLADDSSKMAKGQIRTLEEIPGYEQAKGLLGSVAEGVSKHSRAFRDAAPGDYREMATQGLMTAGSLIPGMSPLFDIGARATGMSPETGQESVLDADPRAAGELGGNLALAVADRLPWGKLGKGVDSLAKASEARQVSRYAEGLKPTKGNFPAAQELAAEAIERGIYGTSKGLNKQGAVGAEKTGKAIGDIFHSERSQTPASIDPVVNALEELAQKGVKGGQEFAPELNAAARSLQEKVRAMAEAKGGQPSAFDLWELKQLWDDPVARKGAYAPGADPALTAKLQAQEAAANAAREALGEALPEVKPLNKDYHFYKQLEELTDPQVMSQANSLWKEAGKMAGAAALGAILGVPGGLLTGAMAFKLGSTILNNPLYKTFTAVQRAKIARALQAGDGAGVVAAYTEAGGKFEDLNLADETLELSNDPLAFRGAPGEDVGQSSLPSIWGEDIPSGFETGLENPFVRFQPRSPELPDWDALGAAERSVDNLEVLQGRMTLDQAAELRRRQQGPQYEPSEWDEAPIQAEISKRRGL
jgi:hypothetical protein